MPLLPKSLRRFKATLPEKTIPKPRRVNVAQLFNDEDALKNAINEMQSLSSYPVDVLLETLKGIDEGSLKNYIDKLNVLCYISLKNVEDIQKLSRKQLLEILRLSKVPGNLFEKESVDVLRVVCRNTMLAIVDRMSRRELSSHLYKLGWKVCNGSKDDMNPVLKLWILDPQCRLFTGKAQMHRLYLDPIDRKFFTNLKFFSYPELQHMNEKQLQTALKVRYQFAEGPAEEMRSRLMDFQEHIILNDFTPDDCLEFLKSRYWCSKMHSSTSEYARRLCLAYLRHPYCGSFIFSTLSKYQQVAESGWTPQDDEIVRKAVQEAKEICSNQLVSQPQMTAEDVYSMLPSRLKNKINVFIENVPILSYNGTILWSLKKDLEYQNELVDVWDLASSIANITYHLGRRPAAIKQRYLRLQVADSIKSEKLANSSKRRERTKENHKQKAETEKTVHKLLFWDEVKSMSEETLRKLALERGIMVGSAEEMRKKIWEHQDKMIANNNNKKYWRRILEENCWNSSSVSLDVRKRVLQLVRSPLSVEFIIKQRTKDKSIAQEKRSLVEEAHNCAFQAYLRFFSEDKVKEFSSTLNHEENRFTIGAEASTPVYESFFSSPTLSGANSFWMLVSAFLKRNGGISLSGEDCFKLYHGVEIGRKTRGKNSMPYKALTAEESISDSFYLKELPMNNQLTTESLISVSDLYNYFDLKQARPRHNAVIRASFKKYLSRTNDLIDSMNEQEANLLLADRYFISSGLEHDKEALKAWIIDPFNRNYLIKASQKDEAEASILSVDNEMLLRSQKVLENCLMMVNEKMLSHQFFFGITEAEKDQISNTNQIFKRLSQIRASFKAPCSIKRDNFLELFEAVNYKRFGIQQSGEKIIKKLKYMSRRSAHIEKEFTNQNSKTEQKAQFFKTFRDFSLFPVSKGRYAQTNESVLNKLKEHLRSK